MEKLPEPVRPNNPTVEDGMKNRPSYPAEMAVAILIGCAISGTLLGALVKSWGF